MITWVRTNMYLFSLEPFFLGFNITLADNGNNAIAVSFSFQYASFFQWRFISQVTQCQAETFWAKIPWVCFLSPLPFESLFHSWSYFERFLIVSFRICWRCTARQQYTRKSKYKLQEVEMFLEILLPRRHWPHKHNNRLNSKLQRQSTGTSRHNIDILPTSNRYLTDDCRQLTLLIAYRRDNLNKSNRRMSRAAGKLSRVRTSRSNFVGSLVCLADGCVWIFITVIVICYFGKLGNNKRSIFRTLDNFLDPRHATRVD